MDLEQWHWSPQAATYRNDIIDRTKVAKLTLRGTAYNYMKGSQSAVAALVHSGCHQRVMWTTSKEIVRCCNRITSLIPKTPFSAEATPAAHASDHERTKR
jgi:hypothetical protein